MRSKDFVTKKRVVNCHCWWSMRRKSWFMTHQTRNEAIFIELNLQGVEINNGFFGKPFSESKFWIVMGGIPPSSESGVSSSMTVITWLFPSRSGTSVLVFFGFPVPGPLRGTPFWICLSTSRRYSLTSESNRVFTTWFRVRNRWFVLFELTNHKMRQCNIIYKLVLWLVNSNNANQHFEPWPGSLSSRSFRSRGPILPWPSSLFECRGISSSNEERHEKLLALPCACSRCPPAPDRGSTAAFLALI